MSRSVAPLSLWLTGASGVALLATAVVGLGDLQPRLSAAAATSAERRATLERVVDRSYDADCIPDRTHRRAPTTVDPEEI
ncbi:MAG: hypothetical protein AB7G37_13180 [Solirubrobacteraceae bacterium]